MSCVDNDVLCYSVGEAPSFITTLDDQEVELDTTVTLTCEVTGKPRPTVTWYHDNQEIKDDKYRSVPIELWFFIFL